jgi:outer membrane protein
MRMETRGCGVGTFALSPLKAQILQKQVRKLVVSLRSQSNPMKLKFVSSLTAGVVLTSAMALAQAGGATNSAALPAAPGAASDPPAAITNPTGSKLAAINIEGAIFASNEGQRDMNELQKKFQPKSDELKTKNDELEALKKKLNTQSASLNDTAKADLQREIDTKQKSLDREAQDAREDFQGQQNEIGQRILQKMAPLILKYAQQNSIGMLVDTSNPWPQGPVIYSAPVDITKNIVDEYNTQSGVAPPPKPASTAKPASGIGTTPRSTGTSGAKPSTPSTTPRH